MACFRAAARTGSCGALGEEVGFVEVLSCGVEVGRTDSGRLAEEEEEEEGGEGPWVEVEDSVVDSEAEGDLSARAFSWRN